MENQVCPCCGYCPACKRRARWLYVELPYTQPVGWTTTPQPIWVAPYPGWGGIEVTC